MRYLLNVLAKPDPILEYLFIKTCSLVLSKLDEKPFHIWSGFNVAVFDSVFTTLSHNLKEEHNNLYKNCKALKADENFVSGVRGATADESIVQIRMSLAKQHLLG